MCSDIYNQVCGWYGENVRCKAYPCAREFSNSCAACADSIVEYFTDGPCPTAESIPKVAMIQTITVQLNKIKKN